jgi:hypothetical protein
MSFIDNAMNNQKTGVRVFVITSRFVRLGIAEAFLDYKVMPPTVNRDFPVTVVNAYQASDISKNACSKEMNSFSLLNSQLRLGNRFNDIIENPSKQRAYCRTVCYEEYRDSLIASYINEGLKRRQLCVYASIYSHNEEHLRKN